MKRYGKSAAGRVGAAAVLRALGVLVRHHPRAAVSVAGAGLKEAGRAGIGEIKEKLPFGGGRHEDTSAVDESAETGLIEAELVEQGAERAPPKN